VAAAARSGAPAVSVLVIHVGRTALLEGCLESLHATTRGLDPEIVVVDNRSAAPDEVAAVVARYPRAQLVRLTERVGYGAATNAGLRQCAGRYVLWCNNDLVFRDGAVARLAAFLDGAPAYAVASPKLLNPDGTVQYCFALRHISVAPLVVERLGLSALLPSLDMDRHWRGYEHDARDVAVGAGACCLIRRAALDTVGGRIDADFFMYAEEYDLCHRLWQAGWRVRYLPDAAIVHLGSQSSHGAPDASKFPFAVQGWRSKFRYLRKHYGLGAELAYAAAFAAGAAGRAAVTGMMAATNRIAGRQAAADELWARVRLHAYLAGMALRSERRAAERLPAWPPPSAARARRPVSRPAGT
jgi:GT2 family glycosyltransferase